MKKLILLVALMFGVIIIVNGKVYSANEMFRSNASGNWNAIATWQMSTDGGSVWFAATKSPNDSAGVITVRSPNTVTVTVNVNADQLIVNAGGIISINNLINLTIVDGSGVDFQLQPGGIISGTGNLQTQGTDVSLIINSGSTFSAPLKVNTGQATSYDNGSPYTAKYTGTITIDAGATLHVNDGGYGIQANNTVTNNGKITASNSTFKMYGASMINNDTIRPTYFEFDSTTSLSGTGVYTSAFITAGSTGNVSLANNVTFSPTTSFTCLNGSVINPNTRIFNFNSGSFILNSGATVLNSGTFQTQNSVNIVPRGGSNFNAPLKVNTGTATTFDDGGPYNAKFNGTITIDAGAALHVRDGGYYTQSNNSIINNGSITGVSSTFYMRGASLTNNGPISVTALEFDSTTSIVGTGTYTSNTILVPSSGNLTITNNVTFSPVLSFTIQTGGTFNPGNKTFTFTSGTFVLENGAVVSGVGPNAGTMQTQGNVNFDFRNGSVFNSAVKVNTGTLNAYANAPPFKATFFGPITIDAGATMHTVDGGYFIQANSTVTNNGSITGISSTFIMKGPSLINNSSISLTNLNFDTTTSLSGTGTYLSNFININGTGNVSLSNNVTFSPATTFTINTGGVLNPNTKIFTINTGTFIQNSGSTVSNSGTFQTQASVTLNIHNGANFNAPLKINTGTTNAYDSGSPFTGKFNGSVTIDAGATLNCVAGGYFVKTYGSVTNNGNFTAGASSTLLIRGSTFSNSGTVNPYNLEFDTTTTLSGAGSYSPFILLIAGSGNVSLANSLSFTPTSSMGINGGGILNPNSFTVTLSTTIFTLAGGATVSNSGIFQTQGNITMNVNNGSNFNAPLKVNTGTNSSYDSGSPFTAVYNGTVTIDAGATLATVGGGYFIKTNSDVTNNGTYSAVGGSTIRFSGNIFTNNGIVSGSVFNFETGSHTLQGTGSWSTNANILTGANVTLASNHQMSSVNVNSGGTFNLSTFKLLLTASNPIVNSGTLTTTSSTVEYDGTLLQTISTAGITYNRLRINNTAGTALSGAVTVNDTLSVILGDLDLNGFILTVSPAGYLTETAGNNVKGSSGYLTTTRNINAPSALNVGGFGAVLTTTVNLGSTEIRRGNAVQSGLGGNTSILRYYDVLPTTNTGLNATLVFNYDESELNGKVESALSLYRSTNTGSTWTVQGGTVNTVANNITLSGIPAFSRWSASSASAVTSTIKLLLEGFYNIGTGRMNMRDTVRAYLRNTTTPYAVVDSAKSVIDSVTFNGSFLFANAPTGSYYIQTKHRNALETWSKTGGESYTLGSALNYDFTTDSSKAYGKNMKKAGTKWVLFEGDVNQDGFVDLSDEILINNDANIFLTGYVNTDVNGDRLVDLTDLLITYNNASIFVTKARP